jgi:hypothetical protein
MFTTITSSRDNKKCQIWGHNYLKYQRSDGTVIANLANSKVYEFSGVDVQDLLFERSTTNKETECTLSTMFKAEKSNVTCTRDQTQVRHVHKQEHYAYKIILNNIVFVTAICYVCYVCYVCCVRCVRCVSYQARRKQSNLCALLFRLLLAVPILCCNIVFFYKTRSLNRDYTSCKLQTNLFLDDTVSTVATTINTVVLTILFVRVLVIMLKKYYSVRELNPRSPAHKTGALTD